MRNECRKVMDRALVTYWNWELVDVYNFGTADYSFVLLSI